MSSILKIKNLVTKGSLNQAKDQLQAYKLKKSSELALFAELCRRLSLSQLAIQKLRPFVYETGRKSNNLSDEALVEYGFNLHWLGVNREALRIFQRINEAQQPRVYLAKAFIKFQKWDYASAIPELEAYVQSSLISNYDKLVGQVNLLLAYSESVDNKTEVIFKTLLKQLDPQENALLIAHTQRIYAQYFLNKKQVYEADFHLKEAWKVFQNLRDFGYLEYQRNVFLSQILQKRKIDETELREFKETAIKLKSYEPIRFVDVHLAQSNQDSEKLKEIYWRTPHRSFRERIKTPNDSIVTIQGNNKAIEINLKEGEINNIKLPNEAKGTFNRILNLALGDSYRRYTSPEACDLIFDDSFFDPKYSRDKLFQATKRFNQFCEKEKIDLKVRLKKRFLELKTESSLRIDFSDNNIDLSLTPTEREIFKLLENPLSSEEISQARNSKKRTVQVHLANLLKIRAIKKIKKGKNIRYIQTSF